MVRPQRSTGTPTNSGSRVSNATELRTEPVPPTISMGKIGWPKFLDGYLLTTTPTPRAGLRVNVASRLSRSLLRLINVLVHVPRLKSVADARASACPHGSTRPGKSSVGGLSKGVVCVLPGPARSFKHFAVGI